MNEGDKEQKDIDGIEGMIEIEPGLYTIAPEEKNKIEKQIKENTIKLYKTGLLGVPWRKRKSFECYLGLRKCK